MVRLRSVVPVVMGLSLLLTAAGCGSDADAEVNTTLKGDPIRVAVLVNESGPLPSGEENATAVLRAWADEVNRSDGVGGRPVELVIEDTKGDAPTATAAATKVTDDSSIVAAVMFDAATEGLVAEAITEAGLPVIGGMGYAPNAWGTLPNWLPLTTSIPSIFTMGIVLGESLGANSVAMTICAEIAGCEGAEPVVQAASDHLGLDYTGTYKISSSAPDYTAECLKILESGTDYVMLGAATATAALRVAADCTNQHYEGAWGLFGGVIVPKTMRAADPGVPLSLALNSFPWFADTAPAKAYRDVMSSAGVDEDVWGDPHGTAAYATVELFKKTLDAEAGSLPSTLTRNDVIGYYGEHVKEESLDGLLPQPVTFTPGKPAALVTCYWFGTFDDGHFTDADLDAPVCDPEELVPEAP